MYYRLKQFTVLAGDLVSLYLGLFLALILRYWDWSQVNFFKLFFPMGQIFLLAIIINFIIGLYDLSNCRNSWKFFQKIILSGLIWLGLASFYFYFSRYTSATPKTILLLTAGCGFGLICLWRYFHNKFLAKTIFKVHIVCIGMNQEIKEIINLIKTNPELGYHILGVVEKQANLNLEKIPSGDFAITQNLTTIYETTGQKADLIIVAPEMVDDEELTKELYGEIFRHAGVVNLEKFYEELFKRIPPFTFSQSWFLANLEEQKKKMYDRIKILLDYFIAIIIAIFFGISYPFVCLAIKFTSPGPIFFKQKRVGRGGRIFAIYKYRTMKSLNTDGSAEMNGPKFAEVNDTRITTVGKFLRKTRLDEIPQFINILRGEMSLVGPRPERPEFVAELTGQMPFYSLRHLIKPGLTGWAQIHKSYYGTLEENLKKLEYDLYYLKNRGPVLDIVIILRTLKTVARMMGR
jgi:exopolysaccharide biosynthesis polyprenyl glycosylphosphotransferase